ncbi:4914_t:CDS:2, partial [Scutellospora calospora]
APKRRQMMANPGPCETEGLEHEVPLRRTVLVQASEFQNSTWIRLCLIIGFETCTTPAVSRRASPPQSTDYASYGRGIVSSSCHWASTRGHECPRLQAAPRRGIPSTARNNHPRLLNRRGHASPSRSDHREISTSYWNSANVLLRYDGDPHFRRNAQGSQDKGGNRPHAGCLVVRNFGAQALMGRPR